MVIQTAPAGNKSNVGHQDAGYRRALPATRQEAAGEVPVPRLTKGGAMRIVAPLLSVFDWLSGPPLTQRDRRVREIEEADRFRRADLLSSIY